MPVQPPVVATVAPPASAVIGGNGSSHSSGPPGRYQPALTGGASLAHPVSVALHPSVSASLIILAVALAIAGALLADASASWRIARLRPADALARVA